MNIKKVTFLTIASAILTSSTAWGVKIPVPVEYRDSKRDYILCRSSTIQIDDTTDSLDQILTWLQADIKNNLPVIIYYGPMLFTKNGPSMDLGAHMSLTTTLNDPNSHLPFNNILHGATKIT